MDFKESRIYKSLTEAPHHKVAKKILRLTSEGRDVNFTGDNGDTYLHVVAAHADKFRDPRAVPVVYQLCLSGINVNAKNDNGDTCLHMVIRTGSVFRIIIALLRCGADPTITDRQGRTAEDILRTETPSGWDENLYWLKKYSPGIRNLLTQSPVDTEKLEQLLLSWCRLVVTEEGTAINLLDRYTSSENPDEAVVNLLQRHLATNELATATLAGCPKTIAARGMADTADINTGDHSYRYHYLHTPEVVQPLLAAAWEQDDYKVIDAVMSLQPDTKVLYANHGSKSKKPLLFHVLSGTPRPENMPLVHRVLRGSDLSVRNHKGQTVLFEAVSQDIPVSVFNDVLTYGVDLASRDCEGRTVRDYAESLRYDKYVKAIDQYVIKMVDDRNIDVIEGWVTRAYDHVSDVVTTEMEVNERLRERIGSNRLYKDIAQCLQGLHRLQRLCRLLMDTADKGDVETLRKHATGHVTECRNRCGQTLLHRVILAGSIDNIVDMLSAFPYLMDIPDNFHRFPIHYVNLFFGETHDVSRAMRRMGMSNTVQDIYGRRPSDYTKENLTPEQHNAHLKEVRQFESQIFLRQIDFEDGLSRAIKAGNQNEVKDLIAKAGSHVRMSSYSQYMFDCIDNAQPEIAFFLLQNGCDPDVKKQYEQREPTLDACVMSESRHLVISLAERSRQLGYEELAEYIEGMMGTKVEPESSNAQVLKSASGLETLAQA